MASLREGSCSSRYDAENRLVQVDAGATATYVYDPEGHRVQKSSTVGNFSDPAGTNIYLYDQSGRWVLELDPTGATFVRGHIYAGSRHLATVSAWMTFSHSDWLGTERVRNRYATPATLTACTGLPFGDGLNCSGIDEHPVHFTAKPRDSESGLDYFGARFDSSSLGRLMSPDPNNAGALDGDPQTWNAYAYVRNNPLNLIDPTGLNLLPLKWLRSFSRGGL